MVSATKPFQQAEQDLAHLLGNGATALCSEKQTMQEPSSLWVKQKQQSLTRTTKFLLALFVFVDFV
jgi:hypothetical protein